MICYTDIPIKIYCKLADKYIKSINILKLEENIMEKTSKYIYSKKSKRNIALFLVLLLISIVGVSIGVNYRDSSHAADTISIELDFWLCEITSKAE